MIKKYETFYYTQEEKQLLMKVTFESIYNTIISNKQKLLGKGSGWIIDSVIDHITNISK